MPIAGRWNMPREMLSALHVEIHLAEEAPSCSKPEVANGVGFMLT